MQEMELKINVLSDKESLEVFESGYRGKRWNELINEVYSFVEQGGRLSVYETQCWLMCKLSKEGRLTTTDLELIWDLCFMDKIAEAYRKVLRKGKKQ